MALEAYAHSHNLGSLDLDPAIHAASTNLSKGFPSVAQTFFGANAPTPKEWIRVTREAFQSPFFDVLQQHVRENGVNAAFIQNILNLPLVDARGLLAELR